MTGTFFRALAVTVSVSLLTSLALALSWTPTLSQYFISSKPPLNGEVSVEGDITIRTTLATEEASLSGAFGKVVQFYERVLKVALERPRWIALMSIVLIACAYISYRALDTDLLPEMDEGGFISTI